MKRLLRIFELSKSEQRVVLILVAILIAVAFLRYERRVHHHAVHPTPTMGSRAYPTAADIKNN